MTAVKNRPGAGKKILLVEDERVTSMAEAEALRSLGFDVSTAYSGEEALSLVRSEPELSLVLMDIDLGSGMDGTKAAREILALRAIPIVFLTSHFEKEYVDRVKEITRYGYVIKNSGNFVLQSSIELAYELFDAHQALQESEERYRHIVENAPYGIAIHSGGVISYVNRAAVDIIGFSSASDAVGQHLLDRVHPDSREIVYERMKQQLIDGKNLPVIEEMLLRADGTICHADVSAIQTSFMGTKSVIAFFNDITEKKIAEESTRHWKERYDLIVASSGQVAYEYNVATGAIAWGQTMEKVIGYAPDEYSGGIEQWEKWIHPDDRDSTLRLLDEAKEACSFWDTRYRLRHKKGHYVWVRDRGYFIFDDRGRALVQIGMVEDISDHLAVEEQIHTKSEELEALNRELSKSVRMLEEANDQLTTINSIYEAANNELIEINKKLQQKEEALRASELMMRTMVSNISDVIAIVNPEGFITYKSENITAIFGWAPDELVGLHYTATVHPDDLGLVTETFHRLMADTRAPLSVEYRYKLKNGSYSMIHLSASNLCDDPSIRGILVNYRDISRQKADEKRIRELLSEKDLLLKEVHHRIKNNMNTVMSLISLQAENLGESPASAALKDARSRIGTMMLLYDRLYRSENLDETPVDDYLLALISDILAVYPHGPAIEVRTQIGRFNLSVAKMSALGIIVNELVTNAMKHAFGPATGGVLSVSASLENRRVTVVVEDNGPGMPASCDPGTSRGFGMQLVAMLANQLDGAITLERARGTRHVLTFDA